MDVALSEFEEASQQLQARNVALLNVLRNLEACQEPQEELSHLELCQECRRRLFLSISFCGDRLLYPNFPRLRRKASTVGMLSPVINRNIMLDEVGAIVHISGNEADSRHVCRSFMVENSFLVVSSRYEVKESCKALAS